MLRRILVIAWFHVAVINLKEGQVLDAAAYISVTIGRLTPWMTRQSLILNDAVKS